MRTRPVRTRRHQLRVLLHVYRGWRRHPEYRLCQLISNATFSRAGVDVFYVTDEDLFADLDPRLW